MEKSKYLQALSYAYKCSFELGHDLVHQAYLMNHNKDQSNLFDKPIYTILNFVKYAWFLERRRNQHQHFGEVSFDRFISLNEMTEIAIEADDFSYKQLIEVVEGEILKYNAKKNNKFTSSSVSPEKLVVFFKLYIEGNSFKEICQVMDISDKTCARYKKKIIHIFNNIEGMTVWANPFNGSKLTVNKTITEAQWEKRKDKEDFESEDYNEYYKLYRHVPTGDGYLVRLPEQDVNPYIQQLEKSLIKVKVDLK